MHELCMVTVHVFVFPRYVLDGWPLTKAHVDLLTRFHIIPVCIVELEVGDQEVLRRGEIDRGSPNRWGGVMYLQCNQEHVPISFCLFSHAIAEDPNPNPNPAYIQTTVHCTVDLL